MIKASKECNSLLLLSIPTHTLTPAPFSFLLSLLPILSPLNIEVPNLLGKSTDVSVVLYSFFLSSTLAKKTSKMAETHLRYFLWFIFLLFQAGEWNKVGVTYFPRMTSICSMISEKSLLSIIRRHSSFGRPGKHIGCLVPL